MILKSSVYLQCLCDFLAVVLGCCLSKLYKVVVMFATVNEILTNIVIIQVKAANQSSLWSSYSTVQCSD